MAWYRVEFWEESPNQRPCDADDFVRDYCHRFRTAGLRIPAAFERRSPGGLTYFLNPLASSFYFNAPNRTERARILLRRGVAQPLLQSPDLAACRPVDCTSALS